MKMWKVGTNAALAATKFKAGVNSEQTAPVVESAGSGGSEMPVPEKVQELEAKNTITLKGG